LLYHDKLLLCPDGEGQGFYLGVYRPVDSEELQNRHLMPKVYLWPYHVQGEKKPPSVRYYLEWGQLEVTQQFLDNGLKR
jgi:hypothetical protein